MSYTFEVLPAALSASKSWQGAASLARLAREEAGAAYPANSLVKGSATILPCSAGAGARPLEAVAADKHTSQMTTQQSGK